MGHVKDGRENAQNVKKCKKKQNVKICKRMFNTLLSNTGKK